LVSKSSKYSSFPHKKKGDYLSFHPTGKDGLYFNVSVTFAILLYIENIQTFTSLVHEGMFFWRKGRYCVAKRPSLCSKKTENLSV